MSAPENCRKYSGRTAKGYQYAKTAHSKECLIDEDPRRRGYLQGSMND
jgi:hypothetical protein